MKLYSKTHHIALFNKSLVGACFRIPLTNLSLFYIKNKYFWNLFKSKLYQEIFQNAPNCTTSIFSGYHVPETPITNIRLHIIRQELL